MLSMAQWRVSFIAEVLLQRLLTVTVKRLRWREDTDQLRSPLLGGLDECKALPLNELRHFTSVLKDKIELG